MHVKDASLGKGKAKLAIVSAHLPHPESTATGRCLLAWCEGAIALGQELEVWTWGKSRLNISPASLPPWCKYEPFDAPGGARWREHLHSLFSPRSGITKAGWRPPDGAVAVADDQESCPAVVPFDRSVATIQHRAVADAIAMSHLSPSALQWSRAEHRAARRAALTLVQSQRVAKFLRGHVRVVPIS
ncbi:MAG TPA: hypothetical protein VME46_08415, partial [Acidimicrobiales bacterium]|nr:hypothetical protein [Acidimicrobiales bacterium]